MIQYGSLGKVSFVVAFYNLSMWVNDNIPVVVLQISIEFSQIYTSYKVTAGTTIYNVYRIHAKV